ncbi:YlmH/Sll1252 family protein [Lactobacillaceae bacterium L1_55_11]|nr:YlmH/Sll1252 family protein [Lactobacillaceae bacterium L1_55_11]
MSTVSANVGQHFAPEEQQFLQQAGDWISQAQQEYRQVLTGFLNPRQQFILQSLVNRAADLKLFFDGGTCGAEARRAIVAPDYFEPQRSDFDLALLEVDYPQKFTELHHADILGAVLNLGIEREMVGDILTDDGGRDWQLVLDRRLADFVATNLVKIKHNKVKLEPLDLSQIFLKLDEGEQELLLLSSLRLDQVVAAAFHLQRSRVQEMIGQGLVRVNWVPVQKNNRLISLADTVSVRHFGRIQLKALAGHTKKDKIKATVNIIKR